MVKLHWNQLDSETKEQLLSNACINERFQYYEWDEMDGWLSTLIADNVKTRSRSTVIVTA